jgi:nicotinamidase/pyrazinamidase
MSTALLVIDVQNDFLPGGALAVPDGDAILPVVREQMAAHALVVLTQDWHPAGHGSFASTHGAEPFSTTEMPYGTQVLWPDHCVQGSTGAAFAADLPLDAHRLLIRKGTNPAVDSYSAFFENDHTTPTGLGAALRELGVDSLVLVGLATDYCVKYTALDGRKLGFDVTVLEDGVRGIAPDTVAQAWDEMAAAGVTRS